MESTHKTAGELIMRCFNLRTVAHVAHLKTSSYAQHVALNELLALFSSTRYKLRFLR